MLDYWETIPEPGTPEHDRAMEVFEYYGNFSRSLVSVFEICLGNHAPPVRVLMENVSEWFGPILLLYRLLVDFAVVKIINGVFLHETRRSLRGVVLTNLAKQLPRRPLAKAREARLVDEGGVVAFFWLN